MSSDSAAAVLIRHFTDPSCPWAFSAERQRLRLLWLYGDQIDWQLHVVVLAETSPEEFTVERLSGAYRRLALMYGMPIDWSERVRVAPSIHACRAVVATRLRWPERETAMLRRLRVLNFAGHLLDDSDTLELAAAQAGLPVAELAEWAAAPDVEESMRADMEAARSPSPASRAQDYKLGGPEEERRYTCPSYELLRATPPPSDWPTAQRVDLPGFRPVEAYEAAIANLAPELTRRPDPASVDDVLAWAGIPLATVEVAAVCDREPAEIRGELARTARFEPVGIDGHWSSGRDPSDSCARFARSMLSVVLSLALALVLLGSAAMKLASGPDARSALATYGIRGEPLSGIAWAALGALEAGLGVCVAAGAERAMWAAAVLFVVFAGAQASALMAGRAGAPCGCFGARGKVGRGSLARAGLLAIAFAALPLLPRREMTTEEWLGVGLGAALLGVAALSVGLLALAREVGTLRMSISPQGALEIPSEGPEVGGRTALADRFSGDELTIALAVFTSEGCHVCHALGPAIESFARHPLVELRRFDEAADADAWALADVPGSPFAVAVGADGTVLAKGTFNSGAQLESVLAAAERRRGAVSA